MTAALDVRHGAYPELARQVRQAGLLRRTPARYATRIAVIATLLVAGWTAFILLGDSWYQLGVAAYLAIVFGQIGFLGHDAGHRQVSESRTLNNLVGLACANLGVGMSYGWWVDKHDRHHGYPNEVGRDPDVGPGAIAWTSAQVARRGRAGRALARLQAALFFPLLLLEALNLHVSSARALRTPVVKRERVETLLLLVHVAGYVTLLLVVLPPTKALVFLVVQQGLFGLYLGCAFAPNHKGMPMPEASDRLDFSHRQVLTARNVSGGRILQAALGGLNYQIEHHLFPTMPMANLRRCQPLVRAWCSQQGLPYAETGLVRSYVLALRYLRQAGMGRVGSVPARAT